MDLVFAAVEREVEEGRGSEAGAAGRGGQRMGWAAPGRRLDEVEAVYIQELRSELPPPSLENCLRQMEHQRPALLLSQRQKRKVQNFGKLQGIIRILPRYHAWVVDGYLLDYVCSDFHPLHHGVKDLKQLWDTYGFWVTAPFDYVVRSPEELLDYSPALFGGSDGGGGVKLVGRAKIDAEDLTPCLDLKGHMQQIFEGLNGIAVRGGRREEILSVRSDHCSRDDWFWCTNMIHDFRYHRHGRRSLVNFLWNCHFLDLNTS